MGGYIDLHVDLIKGGMQTYGVTTNPIFMPGRTEPRYSEFLTFVGFSVDAHGEQHYLDTTLAYQNACLLYTSPSPRDLSTSRMPSSA